MEKKVIILPSYSYRIYTITWRKRVFVLSNPISVILLTLHKEIVFTISIPISVEILLFHGQKNSFSTFHSYFRRISTIPWRKSRYSSFKFHIIYSTLWDGRILDKIHPIISVPLFVTIICVVMTSFHICVYRQFVEFKANTFKVSLHSVDRVPWLRWYCHCIIHSLCELIWMYCQCHL